jgi:hypothetical protein
VSFECILSILSRRWPTTNSIVNLPRLPGFYRG